MRLGVVVSLFGLIAVGCTTTGVPAGIPRPGTLVTNRTERRQLHGFSILPPQGEEWYLSTEARGPRGIIFYKRLVGAPRSHTLYAAAGAADLKEPVANAAELLKFLEKSIEEQRRERSRITLVSSKFEVNTSPGAECVSSEAVFDELDNPNPGLRGLVLVVSNYGFDCVHPYVPKLKISFFVSERYARGNSSRLDATLRREVEAFFRSVEFSQAP